MGDTQFLSGTVVAKRVQDGQKVVDLELHMVNQRDTETAYGAATVALPSRDDGLPSVPAGAGRARAPSGRRCSPATPNSTLSDGAVADAAGLPDRDPATR